MPHQCVKCGIVYPDGAGELLKGCSKCSGRFFFFVKDKDLKKAHEFNVNLTEAEKKQIEEDVLDIVGDKLDPEAPVILNFESVRVLKPGKYELDLVDLFKGKPLVYKLSEGKYVIDIVSTFENKGK
ncbi:MAG: Zn-ribbon containing protein [Nanoarchaeota archaeon]|nr:Zn-ribbon containing protein [Nanoarchaeota archaeon]